MRRPTLPRLPAQGASVMAIVVVIRCCYLMLLMACRGPVRLFERTNKNSPLEKPDLYLFACPEIFGKPECGVAQAKRG